MCLDISFFLVCQAFLSSTFGSLTSEYSYSSCSFLSSDDFVRLLTGLTFISKCFSYKMSPTCLSVPSRLQELKPSSNDALELKPSSKDEDMTNWGLHMDLLCIFECVGCWGISKSPPACILDGMSCIVSCSLTFLIVLMFIFKCFPSAVLWWRSFHPPTPWEVEPSFGYCWMGSTAIWGLYVVILHAFMYVEYSGINKFPSSYI